MLNYPFDSADRHCRSAILVALPSDSCKRQMFGGRHEVPTWTALVRVRHDSIHDKFRTPLSIAFAFVATHNHFVLDRGGKVFNQSAPIIKLSADATEDDHLALLGLLNSSTACFWMKQVFHNKGQERYRGGESKTEHWKTSTSSLEPAWNDFLCPNQTANPFATSSINWVTQSAAHCQQAIVREAASPTADVDRRVQSEVAARSEAK